METPASLRGDRYNTNKVFRCERFSRCHMCNCCSNYNVHDSTCTTCEARKVSRIAETDDEYYSSRCMHTDRQQSNFIQIEKHFRRPFSHVDDIHVLAGEEQVEEEMALSESEKILSQTFGGATDY